MIICSCNPFSDKDVRNFVQSCVQARTQEKCTVAQVYRACSGCETANCCQCIPHLRSLLSEIKAQE
jgi:bacterioferritin-associated ferredoxin